PERYISTTGFNPSLNVLTVHTVNGPVTYRLDPRTTAISYNGHAAPLDALYQRAAVRNLTVTGQNMLTSIDLAPITRRLPTTDARSFLLGAILVEFAAILLIVTNAAASTVTREKEDGSLDLLLSTPITSRYYIWGKLRGLVMFVVPLIAVPVISVLLFVVYDFFRRLTTPASQPFEWIVLPESLLLLPIMMIIICAFAAILGMQMSLRLRRTVVAVMS